MPKGTVLEFTKEQGFGKIKLEDGTVLNFDAGACSRFDIGPGDEGEVELREIRGRKIVSRNQFDE